MNHNTINGGTIAKKDKKEKAKKPKKDKTAKATEEPKPSGKPFLFYLGIIAVILGFLITLASLVHNNLKIFVNMTSHKVYGPYDWLTAIIGAIALLIGIIFLMISKISSKA